MRAKYLVGRDNGAQLEMEQTPDILNVRMVDAGNGQYVIGLDRAETGNLRDFLVHNYGASTGQVIVDTKEWVKTVNKVTDLTAEVERLTAENNLLRVQLEAETETATEIAAEPSPSVELNYTSLRLLDIITTLLDVIKSSK